MTLRFYKDHVSKWYVDLPEWQGSINELEMVAGSDHFLNMIAEGDDELWLKLTIDEFRNSESIELIELGDIEGWELGTGAWYKTSSYKNIPIPFEMWLCDVAKSNMVFGYFPKKIYFKRV